MNKIASNNQLSFVCPKCKESLKTEINALICTKCNKLYPIYKGIPDFICDELKSNLKKILPIVKFMDLVAPIYETKFWQQLNLKLAGAQNSSLKSLAIFHSKSLNGVIGNVIDIACGPATYGRRIASPSRCIYGVDISMGILQKGKKYITKEKIGGVRLAHARVEELPFENAVFDGAICSGSLHLFPDTVLSLREIGRTMKKGAPLSVQTFIAGDTIVNKVLKKKNWVHNFEFDELKKYFIDAGFEEFQFQLDGPIVITFSVRKS
jgi:SAM-dependent methyltransferase